MAHTKNTARKGSSGLPPAHFPQVAAGAGKKSQHYQARNQLPVKAAPSTAAEADSTDDWTQLSPSLPEGAAPPLERVVSQLNAEFEQAPSQRMEELVDLVQDLHENPPAPSVLPSTSQAPVPRVTSETVSKTPVQPLLLAKRAVAGLAPIKARPKLPTAAAKCPRKEFRERQKPVQRRKQKPSSLTSLQEIKKYQTECKPLLPFLPFIRVVRDILNEQGPYKISQRALLALREGTEDHLVHIFEGYNLACMHRDRCTLAPRDICLYCRLNGDEDHLGIEPRSQEAKELDWQKFKSGRLTVAEATVLDTERRRRISAQLRRLRKHALAQS